MKKREKDEIFEAFQSDIDSIMSRFFDKQA